MDLALLLARLVLAGVFLVAGTAKLLDRRGSVQAMRDFGVPERFATPAGLALPIAELAVAILLLPVATAWWGALGSLVLLLAFVGGISINLMRGKQPDCHCFGQLHSAPAGRSTLVRNGLLAAVSAFVLVAGWNDPGASTVAWITNLSAFEGVTLVLGLVILALLVVEGWALLQMFQQNGRLLLRLDALEAAVERGQPLESATPDSSARAEGLRVGTTAPEFSLNNLAGQVTTLADVRSADIPTLLLFSDPGCGPCNALLPDVGRWQHELAARVNLVVVSRGNLEANRSKAGEHGIRNVVLQQDREVAEAYKSPGTPSAVLIRPDGTIGSPVAAGAEAIRRLVATATDTPAPAAPQVPVHRNGNGNGHADVMAPAATIGKAAPDVMLETLDGDQVALSSFLNQSTALLFWNPGCGFCQRMLDDLKALETSPSVTAPTILVISTGDSEINRAQGFTSTVLLDHGFSTGRQFGASGTPSAVLIGADGIVASPIAVGAPAVLELIRGVPQGVGSDPVNN